MKLAESVAVLVSIVLGLALAELGTSLHRLMRARSRVRWDWMSLALALVMLLEAVQFWWLSQGWYAGASELRLIEFLPRLAILLLIYLMAAAVLPDEIPEGGVDLRAFYIETSRYFWGLVVLVTLAIMIFLVPTSPRTDYLGGLARHELLDTIVLAVAIVALCIRNIRVHQGAVVVLLALVGWVYVVSARAFH